ncbi:F-box protein [Striga asiatica]|uniref:F-box protein n=1 Tax=Striga asiatica TaxID=4170 RepID=A0A5A7QIC0_STRAF|nr:F-box protein [Striga asiatica]
MSLNLFAHAKSKFKSFLNLRSTSIIKDEKFMVAQLESSGIMDEGLLHYSIISIKDKYPIFEKGLKYPLTQDYHHPSSICNGLLLLFVRGKDTKPAGEALWNPTTSEFKALPPAPSSFDNRWPSSLEEMRSLEVWVWDGSWSLVSTLSVPCSMRLNSLVGTEKLIFLGLKGKLMLFDCATSKLEEIHELRRIPIPIIKHETKFLVARVSRMDEEQQLDYSIISTKDKFPKLEKDLKYPIAQGKDHHHPSSICNGLLLLLVLEKDTKPPGEALWNPTTGELKILPPSNFDPRMYVKMSEGYFGFGFDSESEDYKVIRLLELNPAAMAELYSLRSNSWKQVSVVHPLCMPRHSTVHFGSSLIPAPPSDIPTRRNNMKLVEYCGYLGAMIMSGVDRSLEEMRSLEIWVWDGSWSLVSTFTVHGFVNLKGIVGTDKLIFDWSGNLMLFDCVTSKEEEIHGLPTSFMALYHRKEE